MVGISQDVVALVQYLLPGFLASWIFHGLTAHRKQQPFERAVQALIFTAIIQALVAVLRSLLLLAGNLISVGVWNTSAALAWPIVLALVFGHVVAVCANRNWYHTLLAKLNMTERTSYPSEWFSTFARHKTWIVLHLTGQRRLYGWPFEWPDHPNAGHFVITEPAWLLDDNTYAPIHLDEAILVPATDVGMVEFVKSPEDIVATDGEVKESVDRLVALQTEKEDPKANDKPKRAGVAS